MSQWNSGLAICAVVLASSAAMAQAPARENPNDSGNTQESINARHEMAAGDSACAAGDRVSARTHYQRAIDDLTAAY